MLIDHLLTLDDERYDAFCDILNDENVGRHDLVQQYLTVDPQPAKRRTSAQTQGEGHGQGMKGRGIR